MMGLMLYRVFALSFSLISASAQSSPDIAPIHRALTGSWAGTLEYRDYSEPAASNRRVKLPTWLTIEPAGAQLQWSYLYDDGPAKTVKDVEAVAIDSGTGRYQVSAADGKIKETYSIEGISTLNEGRGTITLSGRGTENGSPVNVRTTIRIGRNILEITRETAAEGQPFAFRHAYTMVRSTPPGK